ncbi:hypothetical protein T492DRAFT_855209 [Pavlovales sp. CCMP2436]|nr:hypothetical protein T492DRAFT_855209 [Pavlovales sp. CCMP2436]
MAHSHQVNSSDDWAEQYECLNTLRRICVHHTRPLLTADKGEKLHAVARQLALAADNLRSSADALTSILIKRAAGVDLFVAEDAGRALQVI